MTPPVNYLEPKEFAKLEVGSNVNLSASEAKHLSVRRPKQGERFDVTDGQGNRAECIFENDTLKVEILRHDEQIMPKITLIQALIKGERMNQAIESVTEIGVSEIVLWQAENSVVNWLSHGKLDKAEKATERLKSIVQSAAKQSRQAHFPKVFEPMNTKGIFKFLQEKLPAKSELLRHNEGNADDCKPLICVLHEDAVVPLKEVLTECKNLKEHEIILIIGPEGGISPAECQQFERLGAKLYLLTDTVLRAATASTLAVGLSRSFTAR